MNILAMFLLFSTHLESQFGQFRHSALNHIASLKSIRAIGRSGKDQIVGFQGHVLGHVRNDVGHLEYQVSGTSLLLYDSVDSEPEGKIMRILHLVKGYKLGDGRRGVEAFAQCPRMTCRSSCALKWSLLMGGYKIKLVFSYQIALSRQIQCQTVSGHVIHSICLGDVFAGLTDHNAQFHFICHLGEDFR